MLSSILFLYLLRNEGWQIEACRDDYVERVDDHCDQGLCHIAEDGGEECAGSAEKHIIGAVGIVNYICRDREDKAGDAGQEKIPRAFCVRVAVVAREQHYHAGKEHCGVIDHRMHCRERNDRIAVEHGHGIKEIYACAEQSKRADVSAGGKFGLALAPYRKGHCVHIQATSVEREDSRYLQAHGVARGAFPDYLRHFHNDHNCPDHCEHGLDKLFLFIGQKRADNDCGEEYSCDNEVKGSEHCSRQLFCGGKLILMGEKVLNQI